MRLIDADELKDRLKEYCVDGDRVVQNWYEIMGIDSCIDNAPTVDAYEEGYKMGKFHAREEIERCVRDLLAIYGGNK